MDKTKGKKIETKLGFVWVLFGQYIGPSRNKDPRPFTFCFKGLGLVHCS